MADQGNEQLPVTWEDVLRIIHSAPCNDLQLQRLGNVAQVDSDTKMLELAQGLTLTGECWGKKFNCAVEVMTAGDFFERIDDAMKAEAAKGSSSDAGKTDAAGDGDEAMKDSEAKAAMSRYDLIHWTLDAPLTQQELIGASQRLRAALNINGCLIITLPVRIGLKEPEAAQSFYSELTTASLMQPQEVSVGLEEGGFEPLTVEFTHNRQALARYRMIEAAIARVPDVPEKVKSRWTRETKLFLKEGGVSFFPTGIFLARRWEYVDGT